MTEQEMMMKNENQLTVRDKLFAGMQQFFKKHFLYELSSVDIHLYVIFSFKKYYNRTKILDLFYWNRELKFRMA